MDPKALKDSGLPHQYFQKILPSEWTVDVHQRHDRKALFQAYVSPIGESYQSFDQVLVELKRDSAELQMTTSTAQPSEFQCPVSKNNFVVPLLGKDGHTYEKEIGDNTSSCLVENKLLQALMVDYGKFADGMPECRHLSLVYEVRQKSKEAMKGAIDSLTPPQLDSIEESDTLDRRAKRWGDLYQDSRPPPNKYVKHDEMDKRSPGWQHHNTQNLKNTLRHFGDTDVRLRDIRPRNGTETRDMSHGELFRTNRDDVYRPLRVSEDRSDRSSSETGTKPLFKHRSESSGDSRGEFVRNQTDTFHIGVQSRDDVWNPRAQVERDNRYPEKRLGGSPREGRGFPEKDNHPHHKGARTYNTVDHTKTRDLGILSRGSIRGETNEGYFKGQPDRKSTLSTLPNAASPNQQRTSVYSEYREFIKVGADCSLQMLKKKLLGHNHEHINHIEEECGVQLRLRGTLTQHDGEEPLHFLIRAKSESAMQSARGLIRDLIKHTV